MSYKENLKNIKALVFDVDGVFTDGSIILQPDGSMSRIMNVLDGYAIVKAIKEGFVIGIITGGNDPMVKNRMQYLGVTDIYMKSHDKMEDFEDFVSKYQFENHEILFMGDDIPDKYVMEKVGIAACPINAVPEIKEISHYISNIHGGKGCVRDVVEQVMKAQGKWHDDNTQSI
ncbi:3-deoxy-D-manno-octulosonate 8-phosphate phosphatase [Elizabethkingia anophelis]|uniref:KdsC family phosphatase n=1 Tax=Elizabethkingia anophelis TaxID=1117645 RepID=UPI00201105E9|nr:HAD hydrolase family protein [Elizabethkingia anophelis]MCL1690971.1 HAD hydrolase family protein [Elizabethkingia anophelis]MDV3573029.1 3-deoxy-D-manno-octulosonate 8-phosphate phosphatase [Elizabethkingia anophelis]MDV3598513.1 3-deoxy-D-manno-octulosonate 8-phosphate phosphatase [Elizabethkingia anophelis]MDV3605431.1 3-deoxy-D-manno-octulosonate 8-phosphate phosphatase [Elizabethkingia anophelis]MDV3638109.1 3-deoxy-D-manno-octulosonate 8-phosphate phosphatase [Elizabethkingia anopheli